MNEGDTCLMKNTGAILERRLAVLFAAFLFCLSITGCDSRPEERNVSVNEAISPGKGSVQSILLSEKREEYPVIEEINPLLILGFDSLNWPAFQPLYRRGMTPNLGELIESGTRGEVSTLRPTLSDVIWTSVLTCRSPAKHGITHVLVDDPATGAKVPVTSNLRRGPALWNMFNLFGVSTFFSRWLVTWPAEPVKGIQITQHFLYENLQKRSYPERLSRYDYYGGSGKLWKGPETDDEFIMEQSGELRANLTYLQEWAHSDSVTYRMSRHTAMKYRPQISAVFFWGLDRIQHRFYKYTHMPEEVSRREDRIIGQGIIPDYIRFYDGILEGMMRAVHPADILILSDHGMKGFRDPNKYAIRAQVNAGEPLYLVKNIDVNLILQTLDLFKADEFGIIDWANTAVFEKEKSWDPWKRRLFINVAGNAPFGNLQPSRAEDILRILTEKLQGIQTRERKLRLFEKIMQQDRGSYVLELHINKAVPDAAVLIVGDREIPVTHLQETAYHGSGRHTLAPPAFFAAAGRNIRRNGSLDSASVMDIGPTTLALAGMPLPRDADGKVMDLLYETGKPASRVNYNLSDGFDFTDNHKPIKTEKDDELIERMKSLGYIK